MYSEWALMAFVCSGMLANISMSIVIIGFNF